MTKLSGISGIVCPIDLFSKQEREINFLTHAINAAPSPAEKREPAQSVIEAVDVLLACESYDQGDLNCQLCRNFSELRRKVATLVFKAGA